MTRGVLSVGDILNSAQETTASHSNLHAKLSAIQTRTSDFAGVFSESLSKVLVCRQDQAASRVTTFVQRFCEKQPNNVLACNVLGFLLPFTKVKDNGSRYRAVRLIAALMSSLHELNPDDDLTNATVDAIAAEMKTRLDDRDNSVRRMAASALWRMQDPTDPECDILRSLLITMAEDTDKEVRIAILQNLRPSNTTLDHILRMTQDIAPSIQVAAYKIIRDSIKPKKLPIKTRLHLLLRGVTNRNLEVKRAATTMLCNGWFRSVKYDSIELLKLLDVERNGQRLTPVIRLLINHESDLKNLCIKKEVKIEPEEDASQKSQPTAQTNIGAYQSKDAVFNMMYKKISSESVLYCRIYCEHLKAQGNEEALEEALPTLSDFVNFLLLMFHKAAAKAGGSDLQPSNMPPQLEVDPDSDIEFICTQLLDMCPLFDFSDEQGRTRLISYLHHVVRVFNPSQPNQNISGVMNAFRCLHKDCCKDYLEAIETAIVTLRMPSRDITATVGVDIDLAIEEQNQTRAEKRRLLQQLEDAFRKNYTTLSKVQQKRMADEINVLKNELFREQSIWLRCLHLIKDYLENLQPSDRDDKIPGQGTIPDIIPRVVLAGAQQAEAEEVYEIAIIDLGMICHMDLIVVPTYLPVILSAANHDSLRVQEAACKSLFDLLMMWTSEQIEAQNVAFEKFGSDASSQASVASSQATPVIDSCGDIPASQSTSITKRVHQTLLQFLAFGSWNQDVNNNIVIADRPEAWHAKLQTSAVEGFAKLLACNRWQGDHVQVLAQMLLNYYHPYQPSVMVDPDEDELNEEWEDWEDLKPESSMHQILDTFFVQYSLSSYERQKKVAEAGVLACRHALHGHYCCVLPMALQPHSTILLRPMTIRQIWDMMKWIFRLTDCQKFQEATNMSKNPGNFNLHENLCCKMACEILACKQATALKEFKKLGGIFQLARLYRRSSPKRLFRLRSLAIKFMEVGFQKDLKKFVHMIEGQMKVLRVKKENVQESYEDSEEQMDGYSSPESETEVDDLIQQTLDKIADHVNKYIPRSEHGQSPFGSKTPKSDKRRLHSITTPGTETSNTNKKARKSLRLRFQDDDSGSDVERVLTASRARSQAKVESVLEDDIEYFEEVDAVKIVAEVIRMRSRDGPLSPGHATNGVDAAGNGMPQTTKRVDALGNEVTPTKARMDGGEQQRANVPPALSKDVIEEDDDEPVVITRPRGFMKNTSYFMARGGRS